MSTPADQLAKDRGLQEHWIRRFVAFIIDAIIIWVIIGIISFVIFFSVIFLGDFFGFFGWSFVSGVILLFYSAFLEGTRGSTIGKDLLKLKVVYNRGKMDVGKAFVRNISKIHGILLLIDLILGFLTTGDPRQRYLDRIAETKVIDLSVRPPPHIPYKPASSYPKR
jgi:uncharacterized RDD family membrane protein YckC